MSVAVLTYCNSGIDGMQRCSHMAGKTSYGRHVAGKHSMYLLVGNEGNGDGGDHLDIVGHQSLQVATQGHGTSAQSCITCNTQNGLHITVFVMHELRSCNSDVSSPNTSTLFAASWRFTIFKI